MVTVKEDCLRGFKRCFECADLKCYDNTSLLREGQITEAQLDNIIKANGLKKVAGWDNTAGDAKVYLIAKDATGAIIIEDVPWPSDWPEIVEWDWLKARGWECLIA